MISASLSVCPALTRHQRAADLAPLLVRHADHGRLGDLGQLVDHVLHLGRVDVLAARDVHVLDAVDDVVVAVLVAHRDVAGVQPAVHDALRGHFGQLPVAGRDAGALDQQLAALAGRQVAALRGPRCARRRAGTACPPSRACCPGSPGPPGRPWVRSRSCRSRSGCRCRACGRAAAGWSGSARRRRPRSARATGRCVSKSGCWLRNR